MKSCMALRLKRSMTPYLKKNQLQGALAATAGICRCLTLRCSSFHSFFSPGTAPMNILGEINSNAALVFTKSPSLDAQPIVQLPLPSSVTLSEKQEKAVVKAGHRPLRVIWLGATAGICKCRTLSYSSLHRLVTFIQTIRSSQITFFCCCC